jgi:hypothetical protein
MFDGYAGVWDFTRIGSTTSMVNTIFYLYYYCLCTKRNTTVAGEYINGLTRPLLYPGLEGITVITIWR